MNVNNIILSFNVFFLNIKKYKFLNLKNKEGGLFMIINLIYIFTFKKDKFLMIIKFKIKKKYIYITQRKILNDYKI